ncbi:T6SS immunity protein Tli4 family protein [Kosakonia oryziphila]|uniref:Tle cognate immunity protein 4 C-terminal domain-containing protein n=1 Tax=Kosakonia oryziphila TaxID=1005667 RepID=A0A1C4FFS3_9ENTR|nr:T6SS immunity protein Tli4 family protein [Kosakonia oryziphila]SCC54746.1 hypothetical protein GA0061070_10363 [Kosakonia oryziphila]
MHKKKIGVVLVVLVVAFGLWQWLKPYPPKLTLTEQEHKVVDNLLVNLTPRCIGRYQIDLPENLISPIGLVIINKQEIETKRTYLPAFEQRIRLREAELRKTQPISQEDAPFLKNIYPLPNGMKGIVFEHTSSQVSPDAFRIFEGYVYNNGVSFKTTMEATNADSSRYDKKKQQLPEVYTNDMSKKLAELTDLLSRLQGRQENETPVGQGACIPDGFVAGPAKGEEEISFNYQSKVNPRLYVGFSTNNYLQEDTSILERSGEIELGLSKMGGKTLGKGRRDINNLAAEEWLMVGNGEDAASGHHFELNVNEKQGSPKTPFLSIELNHGPLPDEALTANEVMAFWQTLTSTLRMRPGAI